MGDTETKLEIAFQCDLVRIDYEYGHRDVSIEYVEPSKDHWHSDSTRCIELDREKAAEIVAFLSEAFDL